FCFKCTATASRKAALLVLMSNDDGNLRMTNIVPDEIGQLTFEEFNYILEEFLQKFARPAVAKTGAKIDSTSGVVTIDDWFSTATANKLRRFLTISHGSISHSDDDERWKEFLIAAYREGAEVHQADLCRWLVEDAGCDEYRAEKLASDYNRFQDIRSFEE